MGIFQRLRVASGSRERNSTKSLSPSSEAVPSSPASSTTAVPQQPRLRKSSSNYFLGLPKPQKSPPTHPPSSNSGRSSALPWKKRRDEFTAVPYEATVVAEPVLARAPSIPVPTIATYESSPTTPTSSARPSAVGSANRPLPATPTRNGHARASSEAATVISLTSTFTGRSRRSSTASQEAWTKEGGILGSLAFEHDDWGGLSSTGAAATHSAAPSTATSATQSPEQQQPLASRRKYPPPANSSAMSLAMASPPKPQQSSSKAAGMRKLGVALHSPSLPALNAKLDMTSPKERPAVAASTPSTPQRNNEKEEPLEEIRASEADEERRIWRNPLKPRGLSRSSKTDASVRPPSPTLQRRPASQAVDRPNAARRPSSSLFNPFQRTQSRVSLAFGETNPESPPVDDGSFVVRNFRHVSGVSGNNMESDYLSQGGRRDTATRERPRTDSFPSSPQKARPPSAAGSIDAAQRVSVATFRKNIRRPSSSAVLDDDDDLPLSLSRPNLRESALRRDSSALSLTEDSPHLKVGGLPHGSPSGSGGVSPSGSASRSPIPSARASIDAQVNEKRRSLVIKNVQTTWQSIDSKGNEARAAPGDTTSPAPLARERMSSPPLSSTSPIPRPNRKASLPHVPFANPRTPPQSASPQKQSVPLEDAREAPRVPRYHYSPPQTTSLPQLNTAMSPSRTEFLEDIKLPPRPYELDDEQPRNSRPPSRGATISPSVSGILDEPLRRFSGLWGGTPQDEDKDEPFDPALVAVNGLGLGERSRHSSSSNLNRQSLYDRLSAATTGVTNAVGSVAAIVSPPLDSSGERLYIPEVPTPTKETTFVPSPASDRTASPVPVPPPMTAPPAPPPAVSHSSFGRVPKIAASRSNNAGWADSSGSEDEKTPPARRVLDTATAATTAHPQPRAAPGGPRQPATTTQPVKSVVVVESDSEEETLRNIRAKASRGELGAPMTRSSTSSLKSALKVPKRPSPGGRPGSTLTPSGSNWSLSSTSPSPEASPVSATGPPTSRPSSRMSRPGSRANMRRAGSSDRLSQLNPDRPTMAQAPSSDRLSPLARTTSSEHLNPSRKVQGILREPSPRHSQFTAVGKLRDSASPASSQSGLTGDSATQQPMTPGSNADSRRSWADGRPRVRSEATERARPSTVMDQWPGAQPQGYPHPGMEMYAAQAQAQAQPQGYGPPNPAQFEAMKQQMQAQWMTAASRYFEDYWERASTVSNAQTAPNGAFPQPTYGYSYQPSLPPMYPQGYGQFPGNYPYPYPGSPQAVFPGMMPGMMQQPVAMGSMGMPVSSNGGMFSYGGAAQSVYGGEFGPPVAPGAPGMQSPNSPDSPRRQQPLNRRSDRPVSVAHSHSGAPRRVVPPTAPRRSGRSGLRADSPPSSWGYDEETPRPKRVTNAS